MPRLTKLLALMLCLCAFLTFAACGEESPTVNNPPSTDDTNQPSVDDVTPDEPEDTPTEPSEPEKPAFVIDDSPIWNPDNYEGILIPGNDGFWDARTSQFLFYSDDGVLCNAYNDNSHWVVNRTETSMPLKLIHLHKNVKLDIYGNLYKSDNLLFTDVVDVYCDDDLGYALLENGELWFFNYFSNKTFLIDTDVAKADFRCYTKKDGRQFMYTVDQFPSDYAMKDHPVYISEITDEVKLWTGYEWSGGTPQHLFINGNNQLIKINDDGSKQVELENVKKYFLLSLEKGSLVVLDSENNLWLYHNGVGHLITENCKYLFEPSVVHSWDNIKTRLNNLSYIDDRHTLYEISLSADLNTVNELIKLGEGVVYASFNVDTWAYIKYDGTLWVNDEKIFSGIQLPQSDRFIPESTVLPVQKTPDISKPINIPTVPEPTTEIDWDSDDVKAIMGIFEQVIEGKVEVIDLISSPDREEKYATIVYGDVDHDGIPEMMKIYTVMGVQTHSRTIVYYYLDGKVYRDMFSQRGFGSSTFDYIYHGASGAAHIYSSIYILTSSGLQETLVCHYDIQDFYIGTTQVDRNDFSAFRGILDDYDSDHYVDVAPTPEDNENMVMPENPDISEDEQAVMAMQGYYQALVGDRNIYIADEDKIISLSRYLEDRSEKAGYTLFFESFSVIDFNNDGINEVVINLNEPDKNGRIILYFKHNVVCLTEKTQAEMNILLADGRYSFSNDDVALGVAIYQPLRAGYEWMDAFVLREGVVPYEKNHFYSFYMAGIDFTTKAFFDAYMDAFNNAPRVQWQTFNNDNINTFINIGSFSEKTAQKDDIYVSSID